MSNLQKKTKLEFKPYTQDFLRKEEANVGKNDFTSFWSDRVNNNWNVEESSNCELECKLEWSFPTIGFHRKFCPRCCEKIMDTRKKDTILRAKVKFIFIHKG